MEEKILTPEEIEVIKAAKTLKAYCSDRDCSECILETCNNANFCLVDDGCPEFWDVDELPDTKDLIAPEVPGE